MQTVRYVAYQLIRQCIMRLKTDHSWSELTPLPGNAQVAVSHALFVPQWERNKGWGTKEHPERLKQMADAGYDYVICTVNKANVKQLHILDRFGWKSLVEFQSSNTSHTVVIYGRNLKEPIIEPPPPCDS